MDYLIIAFRIITIMGVTLLIILRAGRRQIGELSVYDLISIMVLSNIIGAVIADPDIDHMPTVFAVAMMLLIQYLVSRTLINNKKIAKKITFGPSVIIQNGQFVKSNLERLKYPLENVLMTLRQKDIFDLNEVDFAVVESNGDISVLKKTQYRPLTPADLHIHIPQDGLAVPLICDGTVYDANLAPLNISREWLKDQLAQMDIADFKDVFYANMCVNGKLYVSRVTQTHNFTNDFTLS